MKIARFLGGPWHGEQRTLDSERRPIVLVKTDSDEGRMAAYSYYSPTGDYVIASYVTAVKAASMA